MSSSSNEFPSDSFSYNLSASFFSELDEWEERVVEQNKSFDHMIEDTIVSNFHLFLQPSDTNIRSKRRNCKRDRETGEKCLMRDYFAENPVYSHDIFRRRFRMQKHVFLRIVDAVTATNKYFQKRPDATCRLSISALQKCTAAMRVLAYGTSADTVDEYLRISEVVTRKSLMHFVDGVISNFGREYLRLASEQDLARLHHVGRDRGFPGMIGSIDCMHWT